MVQQLRSKQRSGRVLRGRLAASEELLRSKRRAGHFDARTEALIADIARASTPGPVNALRHCMPLH